MRRLLALALLLLALPANAATRLYFGPARSRSGSNDSFITPAADAGWETTASLHRGEMHVGTPLRGREQPYGQSATLTPSSADQSVNMQYQTLMPAGVTFTSGSTSVKMQGTVREHGSTHDVNQCIMGIRIIDDDGTTVNATLLAVANYGATLEFITGGGTDRNHTCADGDTVTATYTTAAGDWLVVEVGFQNDGATGASSSAASFYGDGSGFVDHGDNPDVLTSGDCPVDNTTSNCTAWIEFSNTWTAPTDAGPATRFWFPADTAADVSPTVTGPWVREDQEVYRKMVTTKGSSTLAAGTTIGFSAADFESEVDRVYVSAPMAAGNVFTKGQTTFAGQVMTKELATTDDVRSLGAMVKVVSRDGTTTRALLITPPLPVGHTESSTAFRNQSFLRGTAAVNSYTTVAGDRLVVEIGCFNDDDGSASTTPQCANQWGEDASDCAVAFTGATNCAGWFETSAALSFEGARNPLVIQ